MRAGRFSTGIVAALLCTGAACAQDAGVRVVAADMRQVKGPRDMAWQMCVGSGHAGLMRSDANQRQMRQVEREIGFRFVRFHGLLTDDMQVYSDKNGKVSYNWTNVDDLYDKLLKDGIKPFVELGFMPNDLASGTQSEFYWKANVTPPKDMAKWSALIEALVHHFQQRYGDAEVKRWYFEVWNEPNYPGFWPDANQANYFKLYDATSIAIKKVNSAYRVGGPATAGAGWVPEFIAHTVAAKDPVDFISTHTYAVSQGFLDTDGNADLVLSTASDAISGDVKRVHEQILASARPELPLEMTEWSASYSSRDPVHDSYTSAAFVLEKLKQVEGMAAAMSYWTYSDLFEENGPPPAAFHGGFGLLTRDDIPKATYFSYKYLNELGATELTDSDARSWLTKKGEGVAALAWDSTPLKQTEGNKALYRKLHPPADVKPMELKVAGMTPGRYAVKIYRTGYKANDAYSTYIEMGLPKDLSSQQLAELKGLAADAPESTSDVMVGKNGLVDVRVKMRENDVVLVSVEKQ